MNIKNELMNKIGFLKWARIDPEFLKQYSYFEGLAYISPDVKGIHIVWEESDGVKWHEIKDYPDESDWNGYDTFADWLGDSVGTDAYGDVKMSWDELLHDYTKNDPGFVSLSFLESLG